MESLIAHQTAQSWALDRLIISHHIIEYAGQGKSTATSEEALVRMHFGLSGSYAFTCSELDAYFDLSGHHNNILYTQGLHLEIENKSSRIETFGINFQTDTFVQIAQNGNDPLKHFSEKVLKKENTLFSNQWKTNPFPLQQVIQEMIHCPYTDELKDLFLFSKSIELLVLQAALYDPQQETHFALTAADQKKLIEAKEILNARMESPPSLAELAGMVGINEYKLKKGFKAMFGTTVFGYIHRSRMLLAKRLLLGTDKSAKEIAYETGYSSPQHFSRAFKKEFGVSPKSMRKNP